MKLKSSRKVAFGKCDQPENTVRRLEAIIGRLHKYRYVEQKVTDHLYWSILHVDELGFRSMGKGISPILCQAGAFAEAAEWLASRQTAELPGYVTGHQDLIANTVRLEDLLAHVSSATPATIARIKNMDDSQHWVDGYSLMHNRTVKVPLEFIRRISGPSGIAAGNTLEEAVAHATTEVFERRAQITVLKNKLVMPTFDISTINNPVILEHISFLRSRGIEIHIKDLSFGGALPCVGVYFLDPNIPEEYQFHHFFKLGTDFNREEALLRAFTEYAQGRSVDEFITGRSDEQERVLRHDFRSLKCTDDNDDNFLSAFMFGFVPHRHADFLKEGPLVPFDPGTCYEDCLDDIARSKDILQMLGRDYIAVDLTRPEIGFPIVEVIVPGYSDVLPYHPHTSRILFENITRQDVIRGYDKTCALKYL